jgi:hypothetical protein
MLRISSKQPRRNEDLRPFPVEGERRTSEPNPSAGNHQRLTTSLATSLMVRGELARAASRLETEFSPSCHRATGVSEVGAFDFTRTWLDHHSCAAPRRETPSAMVEVLSTVRNRDTLGIAPSSLCRASRSRRPRKGVANGSVRAFVTFFASPRSDGRSDGGRLDRAAPRSVSQGAVDRSARYGFCDRTFAD